jgi:GNAT superfamily N-acetyltransferase
VSHRERGAITCKVRPVTATDEAGWRQLWHSYCDFYAVTIPPANTDVLWQRIMDHRAPIYALVAEAVPFAPLGKTELIGLANYVLHPFTWGTDLICYLEDLFVAEHARGGGTGGALIDALAQMAKKNGWPRLYWHTHESNEVARSLYDKFSPVDPFVRYVIKVR